MKIIFLSFISLFLSTSAYAIPSFQEIKDSYRKSDAVLLDRHGEIIHEMRVDENRRRLDWTSIEDISPALQKAIVFSEDRRFYEHRGVDWTAIGSAIVQNIYSQNIRGASTITMQVASILNLELQSKKSKRLLWQKWKQIQEAQYIEKIWSKKEILEAYLNLVFFRGELQGVSSASRGLFGKEPHGLNDVESLILTSLLRSPNAPIENAAKKACSLGSKMKLQIDCGDIDSKVKEALSVPPLIKPKVALAHHAALKLLKPYQKGNNAAHVVSTLDWRLQSFAAEILRHHLLSVQRQNVQDGAVLVVENKTGDVLAYIGSSGDLSSARYVNGIHAKRQAGSTLKPFLYALAFEKKLLTAASMIDDSPLDISVVTGIYRPRNYDSQFQGLVSARTALASSLNVPAVKTLQIVGVEPFLQKLKRIGFDGLDESDGFYGPSIALGSADVSLWELANAYRTLANEGIWSEMRLTFDMEIKPFYRREFSKETSFIISDILSDREARSNTFGLESPLSTRFWSAVKTGTSKDMRDNWCIGYSSKYTVGVWVGNFSGEPMWNVSGITGAAPVWVEIMDWLYRSDPDQPKKPATGMLSKKNLSEHAEWFIKGTEPDAIRTGISPQISQHIAYPVQGAIIALDPDIPFEQQKIFFESQPINSNNSHRWVLDGEDMGYSWVTVGWAPVAGKHILLLIGQENKVVDSVNFEVRGGIKQLTEN